MIDVKTLKFEEMVALLREMISHDATAFQNALQEVEKSPELSEREQKIIKLILQDFDQYDEVFKALA